MQHEPQPHGATLIIKKWSKQWKISQNIKVPLLGQVLEIRLFTFCCENQFIQFYLSFIFYREQCIWVEQALNRCISKVTVDMASVCATRNAISRIHPKMRFRPSWLSPFIIALSLWMQNREMEKIWMTNIPRTRKEQHGLTLACLCPASIYSRRFLHKWLFQQIQSQTSSILWGVRLLRVFMAVFISGDLVGNTYTDNSRHYWSKALLTVYDLLMSHSLNWCFSICSLHDLLSGGCTQR